MSGALPAPRYGERSLPDLMPSVAAALGVPGMANPLDLAPARRVCVLLIDGLGAGLLAAHAAEAPFLASLAPGREPIDAGFPATTATSMGSLGTGLPPGAHGLLGYEVAIPGSEGLLNLLSWDDTVDPRTWQPEETVFQRASADGVEVTQVGPARFEGSGLTVAAMRGGRFLAAESTGERVAAAAAALGRGRRSLVYAYYGHLDGTGHRSGCASLAWRLQLAHVDRMARQLAELLPPGGVLLVTADHGMVDVPVTGRVDLAVEPDLRAGVRLLAGEARARYVHALPGAAEDVLAAWRARLGGSAWVLSRDEAIEAGWFGPAVPDRLRGRIGDVVAAARERVSVVDSRRERAEQVALVGLHGSLSDDELLVPLLELRAPGA